MLFRKLVIFLFIGIGLVSLFSQEETDRIVVTGAKTEQQESDTVEVVELITREEIEIMNARNLKEVMENIPGVSIYFHPVATVMMQGFEGAYVKILIDGVELTGDVSGASPIAQIPVSDIERIEIVRGASSVLYGSDAMGGVINIITRSEVKDPFTLRLKQEISSNLRLYGQAQAGFKYGEFHGSLTGSYDYDEGKVESRTNNMGQKTDYYKIPLARIGYLKGETGWKKENGEINIHGLWMNSFREATISTESGIEYDDLRLELGLNGLLSLSDTSEISGFASWKKYDHDVTDLNLLFGTEDEEESPFRDLEGEIRYLNDVTLSHQILTGINARQETLGGDSFEGDTKESNYLSFYLQDTWNMGGTDRFRFVPGLRLDLTLPADDEDLLYKISPKLSFRWDVSETLVYRLSYGMGYKTPSLKQKYWRFFHVVPANFMLLGNPDLKTESSHGFNTSMTYKPLSWLSLSGAAYYNYIYDMITTVIADENGGTWTDSSGNSKTYIYIRNYENKDEAFTTGVDLSVNLNGTQWKSSLGYSWLLARYKDEDTDGFQDLEARVPHQVKTSISHTSVRHKTLKTLTVQWNARQLIDYENDLYSPDYLMVNIRVEQPFFKDKMSIYVGINNVLNNMNFMESSEDEDQEDYYGLYDGLTVYLGVNYTM